VDGYGFIARLQDFFIHRLGLPPPHSHFPLRSACLSGGSLLRTTARLAGGGCRPHTPAFRCDIHEAPHDAAVLKNPPACEASRLLRQESSLIALLFWGCRPHTPAFRCDWLVLQTARYRGQRSAWRAGAAASPPLSAALGLPCRRLATACNGALGRWGLPPPPPRFSLGSACLADGSLPRATRRLAGGDCHPPPLSAALGLSCRRLATAGS
jgi:hypothetical protein